ncbi:MAG TPA: hypothetical protein VMX18_03655 [Candidatus Bipolaricaulota bacterium]|nr:hypothetical protein [Candidatus Bipolaricaulota bacterium]
MTKNISQIIKSFSKKDWLCLSIISLVLIAIVSITYIFGLTSSDADHIFNGRRATSPGDTSVYFSYINQAKQGDGFFINQFTSEKDELKVFNIFWLMAGKFAAVFRLSAPATMLALKILLAPIFVLFCYVFLSLFFENKRVKRLALILISFSSGVGLWFGFLNGEQNTFLKAPIDLWVTESNFFTSFLHSPHFILAWTLLLIVFSFFILAVRNNNWKQSFLAGLTALFLFQFHPYNFLTVYAVCLTFTIYEIFLKKTWRPSVHFLLLTVVSVPSVIYHFFTLSDTLIAARSAQNITLTPPLIYVALGFGIFFPLAIWGVWKIFKNNMEDKYIFLVIWLLVGLLLIYFPGFQFQRRLLLGLQIPIIMLAFIGLGNFVEKTADKIKRSKLSAMIAVYLAMIFILPTSFYHLASDFLYYFNHEPLFYQTSEQKKIIEAIEADNGPVNIIICEDIPFANTLPIYLPNKIFLAHLHETTFFENKKSLQANFFNQAMTPLDAENFIRNNFIEYVISKKPLPYNFLEPIIGGEKYFLYRVN